MHGNITSFKQKAESAADYLEKKQWGNGDDVFVGATEPVRTKLQNRKQNTFRQDLFDENELNVVIKKMKKRKAKGPDDQNDNPCPIPFKHHETPTPQQLHETPLESPLRPASKTDDNPIVHQLGRVKLHHFKPTDSNERGTHRSL